MNKCLVTKLNGVCNNTSLLRINEIRFYIDKVASPTKANRSLTIGVDSPTEVEILGGGYFTDSSLSENKGTKLTLNPGNNFVYVSNNDVAVCVLNKYNITDLYLADVTYNWEIIQDSSKNKHFNIENLKYLSNIKKLYLSHSQISGEISAIKNLANLKELYANDTQISGNISALSDLTGLTNIDLSNTKVSGDISALSDLTGLKTLEFASVKVLGDISALSRLTGLTSLYANYTQISGNISALSGLTGLTSLQMQNTKVSGDISALSRLTGLKELILKGTYTSGSISSVSNLTNLVSLNLNSATGDVATNLSLLDKLSSLVISTSEGLTGDISKLPANIKFIEFSNCPTSTFSWSSRNTDNTIFGIKQNLVITTSLDNMLINMANCRNTATSSTPSYMKVISLQGTRTSASDSAVEKLQRYGYTVMVAKA